MSMGNERETRAAVDESLVRRTKALARTGPVHELEVAKAMRQGDWGPFDLRALSLAAIDAVIEHMGLEYGATSDAVIDRLCVLAAAAAPGRPSEEIRVVARAVLDGLLNDRGRREAFSVPYGEWGTDDYRTAELVFKLLEEVEAPDGTIVLRATDEAVNLFVGALDRDVEDAQAAAEAVLQSQLRRGRIDQAILTAKEARLRSLQFTRKVRRILDATRRDVRQVDWTEDVPRLLSDSLDHLSERLEVERTLLATIEKTLAEAGEAEEARGAAQLVGIVTDCRLRHMDLHRELIGARTVFLSEQERQRFRPAAEVRLIRVEEDLLKPLLAETAAAAEPVAVAFLVRSMGPSPPRQLRLADLISSLLMPPREEEEAPLDEEPDLVPVDLDPLRFPEEVRRSARTILSAVNGGPVRLSDLLAPARRAGPAVAEFVGLTALRAFAPEGTAEALRARDDGTHLEDPGMGGADLLIEREVTE